MTALSLDLTESAIMAAIRAYLISFLPTTTPVYQGQQNRVVPPNTAFVLLTPLRNKRLATNIDTWNAQTQTQTITLKSQMDVQCDCFGAGSADSATLVMAMFRDYGAPGAFTSQGVAVSPLDTSDIRQMPFINDAKQWEQRYTLDLSLEATTNVVFSVQSAIQLVPTFKEVT